MLRPGNWIYVFLAGCVIAFLFTVPGANLIVPILGVVFMMHVFITVCHRGAAPIV